MNYLITFANARSASKASKLCDGHGIVSTVTAVPEDISSECGIALYIRPEEKERFVRLMLQNDIKISIYERN